MNIGERIGDYEIVEVLGAGGMGQVYKVRNVLSERIEAMKVLLPNLEGDPDLAERFLREIKVQAALDHPNIAKLHTALRASNQLLMVMEFVEGTSVEKLLEHGALPVRDAAGFAGQVLDALAYAHSRGVVHRDIKPANIMRTPAGVVKLMDFGIARMKADRKLTQTGRTVGSLYYMSPEQIKGAEPDPRSDLYSLGVALYEMVTGRRPFQGDSDYSIMAAHLQQTPPAPVEIVPGVPGDLSDIIVLAMDKDPASRFQSAEAFRAALRAAVPDSAAPVDVATHTMLTPEAPPPLPFAASPTPVAAAPPVAMQKSNSRRGLYMALGSVATLVVLAAAVIEGPKFLRARASGNPQSVAAPAPAPVEATPAPAPPTETPAPVRQEATPQIPPVVQTPPSRPVEPKAAARPQKAPPIETVAPVAQGPVDPAPAQQTAPQPISPQAAPSQAAQQPQSPPPAPPKPSAELNELREEYNLLSVRAATAKSGLRSIEQQMARQGVGMRGDIREAETRLDYQMKEAMDSIRGGDADNARRYLQMAGYALQTVEKFLGR
jgi:serine/threonine protein kinase